MRKLTIMTGLVGLDRLGVRVTRRISRLVALKL